MPVRTELIWDGKYDAKGKRVAPLRVALPLQTVETINESAQERDRNLFQRLEQEQPWRNRLIWGDKKYVLPSLLPEFAGKVNLIYIDPPFDTGADFSFTATVPEHDDDDDSLAFTKEPSIIEQKAYRDTWGRGLDSYLQWFYETVVVLHELLAENGSIYVHLDWHVVHYAKVIMDEIFGALNARNQITWKRIYSHSDANRFGIVDDTILFYSKSEQFVFNKQFRPHSESYIKSHYGQADEMGRTFRLVTLSAAGTGPARRFGKRVIAPPPGRHWAWSQERIDEGIASGKIVFASTGQPNIKQYLEETEGTVVHTIWDDLQRVNPVSPELLGFPTQKPEALLDRILKASSNENDLILDCFVGSGTTATVAEKLNRRWIACDLGRFAIHTTRKRLLGIADVRPFVVQNLGKYERQLWQTGQFANAQGAYAPGTQGAYAPGTQGAHAPGTQGAYAPRSGEPETPEQAAKRHHAYVDFILQLYHATPLHGRTWLHGVKAGRMVHVGGVEAPVTVGDVKNIAAEFKKAMGTGKDAPRTNGIDVLGWDFAFEINEVACQKAESANIRMAFKRIPRDVMDPRAVEQGDIKFFELAALSVHVANGGRKSPAAVNLTLTDFIIPPDDVPEQVRTAVKHWSQWIDYWAVDWDNKGDTFHNQWQAFRTRRDNRLALTADHTYPEPGQYRVVVKVIDILGNDTTKTLTVKVK